MEFNIVTLDMIFTLGIKEFSGVDFDNNKIEQVRIQNGELYFWNTISEEWVSYNIGEVSREHLEKYYHSFFTWELVENEI